MHISIVPTVLIQWCSRKLIKNRGLTIVHKEIALQIKKKDKKKQGKRKKSPLFCEKIAIQCNEAVMLGLRGKRGKHNK